MREILAPIAGGGAEALRKVATEIGASDGAALALAELTDDPAVGREASWIVKLWLDEGLVEGSRSLAEVLCARLSGEGHWEARLHVLQCVGQLDLQDVDTARIAAVLEACLLDERRLIRAWAFDAYHHVARHAPQYRERVDTLLAEAARVETAGSVKARLKRIRARGYPQA